MNEPHDIAVPSPSAEERLNRLRRTRSGSSGSVSAFPREPVSPFPWEHQATGELMDAVFHALPDPVLVWHGDTVAANGAFEVLAREATSPGEDPADARTRLTDDLRLWITNAARLRPHALLVPVADHAFYVRVVARVKLDVTAVYLFPRCMWNPPLSPDVRQILCLRVGGWSHAEIARILGVTAGAVRYASKTHRIHYLDLRRRLASRAPASDA